MATFLKWPVKHEVLFEFRGWGVGDDSNPALDAVVQWLRWLVKFHAARKEIAAKELELQAAREEDLDADGEDESRDEAVWMLEEELDGLRAELERPLPLSTRLNENGGGGTRI